MKTKILSLVMAAGVSFSLSATAAEMAAGGQEVNLKSNVAAEQLSQHDWSAAEQALLKTDFSKEDKVFAKINLAYLYSSTGRIEQAAAIYKEVVEGRDNSFAMTLSGKPRKVKYIAKDGLEHLASLQ